MITPLPPGARVAVAGGTGVVGRHVVAALLERGLEPVVLARSTGVDVVSGEGVDAALAGAAAVVDVSNREVLRAGAARAFFTGATRTLLDAGRRAGVARHVALSIVGVDRVPLGYYAGKRAQEALVLADPAGLVLRTTQFHEFAEQVLGRSPGPLHVVPRMRVQPLAAREAAQALADLAVAGEPGSLEELAGPEVHELPDLARRVLAARGRRGPVLAVRLPGAGGRAVVDGALLPGDGVRRASTTFAGWLD